MEVAERNMKWEMIKEVAQGSNIQQNEKEKL